MYKQTKNLVQSGSLNILKTYIFVAYGGSYNPSLEFVSIEPLFIFSFVEKSLPAGLPGKGWVIIIQSCQIVQTKSVNHSKPSFSWSIYNISRLILRLTATYMDNGCLMTYSIHRPIKQCLKIPFWQCLSLRFPQS